LRYQFSTSEKEKIKNKPDLVLMEDHDFWDCCNEMPEELDDRKVSVKSAYYHYKNKCDCLEKKIKEQVERYENNVSVLFLQTTEEKIKIIQKLLSLLGWNILTEKRPTSNGCYPVIIHDAAGFAIQRFNWVLNDKFGTFDGLGVIAWKEE
jgi:hypothetical protein